MTTTIQKWGNSQGIRIPKFLLDAVQWSDDEQLVLSADKNKIIIEKAEPRKNIMELFANFDGEYVPVEMDWGHNSKFRLVKLFQLIKVIRNSISFPLTISFKINCNTIFFILFFNRYRNSIRFIISTKIFFINL